MPEISVVVPVYKVEPYLRRCVDSILVQTFTDFEVILVDDGSPDSCGAICDAYAAADDRVHVIHQTNGGLSAARNAGIDWAFQNSNSRWLAFVDSDDWVHPKYLELLLRAVEAGNTKLSVCEFIRTESSIPIEELVPESQILPWDIIFVENNLPAIVAWNKLYAKELFTNLRYPVERIHEDQFLSYKLLIRAEKISYLPAVLYAYFQNPQGIMKRQYSVQRLDVLDALDERIGYIKKTHNKRATEFCVKEFFYYYWENIGQLRTAEHIPIKIRRREERKRKWEARMILLRYGLHYAPPRKYRDLYRSTFPHLYRFIKVVVKPLIRMLKLGRYKDGKSQYNSADL